jgi:hypothetical protein
MHLRSKLRLQSNSGSGLLSHSVPFGVRPLSRVHRFGVRPLVLLRRGIGRLCGGALGSGLWFVAFLSAEARWKKCNRPTTCRPELLHGCGRRLSHSSGTRWRAALRPCRQCCWNGSHIPGRSSATVAARLRPSPLACASALSRLQCSDGLSRQGLYRFVVGQLAIALADQR